MRAFNLEISKKEPTGRKDAQGKEIMEQIKQGDVGMFLPTLADFGLDLPHTVTKDGSLIYATDELNWLAGAADAAAKAKVRNMLVSGTVVLKDGASIPTTIAELITTAERSGEHLANKAAAIRGLVAFVPKAGHSTAVQSWVAAMLKAPEGLPSQKESRRELLKAVIASYIESLSDADASKQERFLGQVLDYCDTEMDEDF